jgi:hypothetical protein
MTAVCVGWGVALALGQTPVISLEAVTTTSPLAKADRARYLCRQLELNPDQQRSAEGFIEVTWNPSTDQPLDIEKVRQIWKDLNDAIEKGDKAKQAELEGELRQLGQGVDLEPEFIRLLEPELTDVQKKRLAAARARLDRNPSGAIRPIDLFDIVESLDPTSDQLKKINDLRENFRKEVNTNPNIDDAGRAQALNLLVDFIKPELTAPQAERFLALIQGLRPEKADRGVSPAPGRQNRGGAGEAPSSAPAGQP